jgi:hypothetical protein
VDAAAGAGRELDHQVLDPEQGLVRTQVRGAAARHQESASLARLAASAATSPGSAGYQQA